MFFSIYLYSKAFRDVQAGYASAMAWLLFLIIMGLTLALSRLMKSLLYGVSSTDAITLVAVSAVLLAAMLAASLAPARRATKISPLAAIRYE